MTAQKIPLVLVSGFLGAGKTTFLSRLLPLLGQAGLRPHLIINDYGEAEIDAAALAHLSASVRAINGSCVCCESQDEFLNLLASEELSPASIVLVETNGTTDPYEIIEALGLDQRAARYREPRHVSIIDVPRWQKRWWHNFLERKQVESASHLFLSKTDASTAERENAVRLDLAKHNPHMELVTPESFAGIVARLDRSPETSAHAHPSHLHATAKHAHDHEDDAHDFVSLQIPLPDLVSRQRMTNWLDALPREVVRAKGFVRLEEDVDRLYSFQKVEESLALDFLPLDPRFAREPLALLIGHGIDRGSLPEL